ncbi:MAG: STAS-like domain-containing protein [Magnetococcales bacterium]|nr:STAS-like domain-containing protein [Magnetococcales bacterium]
MNIKEISVANDFSATPAGRYASDGPESGEIFRDNILYPALTQYEKVIVDLDGTEGYGSSFLEEAFGGIVRHQKFSRNDLLCKLEIRTRDLALKEEINEYINDAIPGEI